ncbi:hypothetical protein [Kitasatospora sp. NPDC086791]|uniref:hypothetical protein n=1 Tax=Kitasatospora sp. NPDC086791 TaxID=3155178 RepID=UPI003448CC23
MTSVIDRPVYTQATRAPWREILRHRWSGRRDRALVVRDRAGLHHLLGERRPRPTEPGPGTGPGTEGGAAGRPGLRGFDRAYLVELDERPGVRAVGLPTPYGMESVEVHVLWWVQDAAQVVRTGTSRGWHPVRKDLEGRLRRLDDQFAAAQTRLGPAELVQYLSVPYVLPHVGLAYRVTDVFTREHGNELRLGEPGTMDVPFDWMAKSQEEYAFCRRAVQEGPVFLAGLWLARRPDEVREVLDWAVNHADLLRGETTWQDQLAGMLGTLTAQEREELSRMLRDRLQALGRKVPGPAPTPAPAAAPSPQGGGPGPEFVKIRSQVNGWSGGVPNGGVPNGGVPNGGVPNGGVPNGGVPNGRSNGVPR